MSLSIMLSIADNKCIHAFYGMSGPIKPFTTANAKHVCAILLECNSVSLHDKADTSKVLLLEIPKEPKLIKGYVDDLFKYSFDEFSEKYVTIEEVEIAEVIETGNTVDIIPTEIIEEPIVEEEVKEEPTISKREQRRLAKKEKVEEEEKKEV
jgi:hypothetical protein